MIFSSMLMKIMMILILTLAILFNRISVIDILIALLLKYDLFVKNNDISIVNVPIFKNKLQNYTLERKELWLSRGLLS